MKIDAATTDTRHASLAAKAYPSTLFALGRVAFDCADEDYRRLAASNALSMPGEPFGLEVIVSLQPQPHLCGHYLRFHGRHRRATFVLRRLVTCPTPFALRVAPAFGEAALVSKDDQVLLRIERIGVNFYATHLSIAAPSNRWTHERFVREARDEFREPSARLLRTDPATRKLAEHGWIDA